MILDSAEFKPDGVTINDTGPLKAFRAHPHYEGKPIGRRLWAQFCMRNNLEGTDAPPDTARADLPMDYRWITIRDRRRVIQKLIDDRVLHGERMFRCKMQSPMLRRQARIHWDRRADRWHLIVTEERQCAAASYENGTKTPFRLVALDPGVSTFQTFYDPTGTHGELLRNLTDPSPPPPKDDLAKEARKQEGPT